MPDLEGAEDLVRLFALRMIEPRLKDGETPEEEAVMWLLGRSRGQRSTRGPRTRSEFARALRRQLTALSRRPIERTGPLFEIATALGELVGLSEIEREILVFTMLLTTSRLAMFLGHDPLGERQICEIVARTLALPSGEVMRALAPDGALRGGGLVVLDPTPEYGAYLAIAPSEIVTSVCVAGVDPRRVLDHIAPRAPAPTLTLDDFAHLGESLQLLRRFLERLLAGGGGKLQVLVHGPPGVGKSELVRALAASLDGALHEVRFEDANGQPLESSERLLAYRLVQRLLGKTPRTLLVFEEIEDLFPVRMSLFGPMRETADRKALTNRSLENARVPTFFVSNEIDQIDPAVLRRFDYVLSLGVPPRAVRQRILSKHTHDLPVSEAWLARIAERADVSPADMERSARFVRGLGLTSSEEVERSLDSTLALGKAAPRSRLEQRVLPYDLASVRTDVALEPLVAGLAREKRGTVLFSGPPGTGKTEAAHEIARRLERPLIVRPASSLLGKYVGESEKNIAAAFKAAHDEGGVLLLDEIDSFLRPRENARYGWEVTQVNELLVQIERFDGVLIATTNFLEGLDRAALRRFAAKVQFLPPTVEQKWQLLLASTRALALPPPTTEDEPTLRATLAALPALAPGHFAAAVRNAQLLRTIDSASTLVAQLAAEHVHEPGARGRAGFA